MRYNTLEKLILNIDSVNILLIITKDCSDKNKVKNMPTIAKTIDAFVSQLFINQVVYLVFESNYL